MYCWVTASEADLRKSPQSADGYHIKDLDQLTQLVAGERVHVLELQGDWARIEALDQLWRAPSGCWQGYPGWLLLKELSSVQKAMPLVASATVPLTKESILAFAAPFLGQRYFWGGASRYSVERPRTGVDCSGLSMLLYRFHGRLIPRDAHDQYLHTVPLAPTQMEPGNLVFTADAKGSGRIDHVMIYVEDETLLEASLTGGCVRLISFQDKLGVSLADLRQGCHPSVVMVFFGG